MILLWECLLSSVISKNKSLVLEQSLLIIIIIIIYLFIYLLRRSSKTAPELSEI